MNMPMRGNGTLGREGDDAQVAFAISQRDLGAGTSLITVEGELDLASAPNLKWTLNDATRAGASRIVLDLAPVTFIDSTALGVLVAFDKSQPATSRLALAGAHEEVVHIFELTGLDSAFDMFANVDEALAWIRESGAAAG
jgi:anti-sigma B factor antagonist